MLRHDHLLQEEVKNTMDTRYFSNTRRLSREVKLLTKSLYKRRILENPGPQENRYSRCRIQLRNRIEFAAESAISVAEG